MQSPRGSSSRAVAAFAVVGPVISVLVLCLFVFLGVVVPSYPALFCRQVAQVAHPTPVPGAVLKRYWVVADPQIEGDKPGLAKELNNLMNDRYYEYVTWVMTQWKGPFDGVVFLGDVFSYQYHRQAQFEKIDGRFRDSFFIPHDGLLTWKTGAHGEHTGMHAAIAGNHDLGYAAELYEENINRWERTFGPRHWSREIHPGLVVVACDGLELDGAVRTTESWDFLKRFTKDKTDARIVLLTHIPLFKPAGSCPGDDPNFEYHRDMISQQNTLSEKTTQWLLDNLNLVMAFSGHDHEGCFHTHTRRGKKVPDLTVRAIQGDYAGNTAVLSLTARGLYVEECTSFTTKTILGALAALTVCMVGMVAYSYAIMRATSTRRRYKTD